jgi:glycosyltransferase involved in cell wall biosynthesis
MNRPLVSIVLPVSNGARYLRHSIESCLCQSYDTLELIVIDDGSTDSTPAIIEEYLKRDRRVQAVSHACCRGLPQALNSGFAIATGQFLTWTSDDNYYRSHAIARMLEVLEGDPKAGLVYSDYSIVDSQGRFLEYCTVGEVRELLFGNQVGACSFLYRREVQEALGKYDEEMFLTEDYDFWLRASARFRMIPLHEDLYCYRVHENSLSARFSARARAISDRCLERNLPNLTWATRPDKASAYLMLARRAQLHGEWGRARRLAFAAFRLAPLGSLAVLARKILRLPAPTAADQVR